MKAALVNWQRSVVIFPLTNPGESCPYPSNRWARWAGWAASVRASNIAMRADAYPATPVFVQKSALAWGLVPESHYYATESMSPDLAFSTARRRWRQEDARVVAAPVSRSRCPLSVRRRSGVVLLRDFFHAVAPVFPALLRRRAALVVRESGRGLRVGVRMGHGLWQIKP